MSREIGAGRERRVGDEGLASSATDTDIEMNNPRARPDYTGYDRSRRRVHGVGRAQNSKHRFRRSLTQPTQASRYERVSSLGLRLQKPSVGYPGALTQTRPHMCVSWIKTTIWQDAMYDLQRSLRRCLSISKDDERRTPTAFDGVASLTEETLTGVYLNTKVGA